MRPNPVQKLQISQNFRSRMPDLRPAPLQIHQEGVPQLGQFVGAIAQPDVEVTGGKWRLKRWVYLSLLTETEFLALAIVQLGYAANLFAYVVDLQTGQMRQTESLAPLGLGLQMAPGPLAGQSVWQRGQNRVAVTGNSSGWTLDVDLSLEGQNLKGQAQVTMGQPLSLVHRLAPNRLAYTLKDAGLPATLDLRLDGRQLGQTGLACIDWTRSAARRTTKWNWASLATRLADGRRLGLNASAHVYENAQGVGQENAIWLDGELHALGNLQFTLPNQPLQQKWRLDGEGVQLEFTPQCARQQDVNLGLIRSRFIQPFGHFDGTVQVGQERLDVRHAFGVVEDHLALW